MNSGHPTLQEPTLIPDEFDDVSHHLALAFDHHAGAYVDFLQGQDSFPEQEKVLEDRYGMLLVYFLGALLTLLAARKDTRVLADLEQLRERLTEIQAEWEHLKKSAVSGAPQSRNHG